MPPTSLRSKSANRPVVRGLIALGLLGTIGCDRNGSLPTQPPTASNLSSVATPESDLIANQYIVVLRGETPDVPTVARFLVARNGGFLRHTYRTAIKGFSVRLSAQALQRMRAEPLVQFIEPDGLVYADGNQPSPTWGLDRVDQRTAQLDGLYRYGRTGAGVSVYIVDTGIQYSHLEFEGRASLGFDAFGGDGSDCNGHGTHVAGTAGGRLYGVAKAVALRSVRVLNCTGSGSYSGVIAGLDWIATYAARPAVVNMSLGGAASSALDSAVARITRAGITVVVAAGNANSDACNFSPARAPDAITIGATDKTDTRATFSNYGSCVDLFAPGVAITSATYTSNDATASLNGTSMASPHAAGAAALYLERYPTASTGEVAGALASWATRGIVKSSSSTHNDLLYSLGDTASGGTSGSPSANFTASCTGSVCQFTDKSSDADGTVAKWEWDFGDGTSAQVRNASHDFVWNGTYRVTLVVTDDKGGTGAYSTPITVTGGLTPNKLPSADFVWECKDRVCSFVDNSSDADGTIVNWRWDFGDGTSATGSATASRYYSATGTYSVTLTVTDDRGGTDTQVYAVKAGAATNAAPVAGFAVSCTGLSCKFTDESTDPDGSVVSWKWTFGNGDAGSTEPSPSHTFPAAGSYSVTLTATDDKGSIGQSTKSVTVSSSNIAPVSSFTAACTLLACSFTDASSDADGTIVKWVWDFGDGSTFTNQSSSHTYPASGTYSVSLTVTDNLGSSAKSVQQVTVSAGATAPVADFTFSCSGTTCQFTDASRGTDGSIAKWRWDFGDGASSTSQHPTRTYSSGGTYVVLLEVTDNSGQVASVSRSVSMPATPIELTAIGYKVKGTHNVDLAWTGASGTEVVVYRNGVRLVQTANDGRYTDSTKGTGRADYLYRVCEVASGTCSADVSTQF